MRSGVLCTAQPQLALREGPGPQQQHGTDVIGGKGIAYTGSVRPNESVLKLAGILTHNGG
jgi:hypothetical protein